MTPTEREPYIEIRNERLHDIAAELIRRRFNHYNGYSAAGTSKFQRAVAEAVHDALYEIVDNMLTYAEKAYDVTDWITHETLEDVDRQLVRTVGRAQDDIEAERGE